MRSWSKCVIFSRRMKSSSSVGPRTPALSELWLSGICRPWLVVSIGSSVAVARASCSFLTACASGAALLPPRAALLALFLGVIGILVRERRKKQSTGLGVDEHLHRVRQRDQCDHARRQGHAPDQQVVEQHPV